MIHPSSIACSECSNKWHQRSWVVFSSYPHLVRVSARISLRPRAALLLSRVWLWQDREQSISQPRIHQPQQQTSAPHLLNPIPSEHFSPTKDGLLFCNRQSFKVSLSSTVDMAEIRRKLVIVGDGACGKTCLLM
jgi:hypothetical protein